MSTTEPKPVAQEDEWLQTYTGKKFRPLSPHPDDICIEDIAHALSNLCRFGGHLPEFYSVAQHSVWVSNIVKPEFALAALLHDATEAYVVDVPRPLKRLLTDYRRIEGHLANTIEFKFGLKQGATTVKEIKTADSLMLCREASQFLKVDPSKDWGYDFKEPEPDTYKGILPTGPAEAKKLFLERYRELTQK